MSKAPRKISPKKIDSFIRAVEKGQYEKILVKPPADRQEQVIYGMIADIIRYMHKHGMNQAALATLLAEDPSRISHMIHYRLDDTGRSKIFSWHERLFPEITSINLPKTG